MNTSPIKRWPASVAPAGLLLALRHLAGPLVRSYRHRRELAELLRCDNRVLADLGVGRLDIHAALASRFPADPARRLVRRGRLWRAELPKRFE